MPANEISLDARALLEAACKHYEQKNHKMAAMLFSKSAALGCNEAKVNLGNMYSTGEGVIKDESKAKNLYRSAYRGGCIYGALALGVQYKSEGRRQLAKKWLTRAKEAGNEWAADELNGYE
ncbi:tetratricopeptide repeat protein [Paenacidovorax monticola]|uniref:Sel1 repeat family protein n=1 Tax=Paenacidovorax monticola TaxID=1926868 RepID=A0A7H0HHB2_9BURK|nr:SEL1-like repeat protein [Paenacidovorax monticola]QNP59928.1 sel1 repeat family protein [Paenacidovorax monticola]